MMNMTYLKLNVENHVALVLINRPDKGNALSPDLLQEIGDLFLSLSQREDVKVVVFTGGEKIFSAGFDLNVVKSLRKETNEAFTALFHRAYRAILFCSQPVIAAIGGPAIAGGFDLTMMCDIRYASEKATFGQREILLGLPPIMDPLWRIIGLGRAKEVALTGRIYDAFEAERMGYVSKLFPPGKVIENAMAIATAMAAFDTACLRETKLLSNTIVDEDLDGAMKQQEWLFRTYIGSEENRRRVEELLQTIKKK
jgi:enoyl-CoA hydratase/carnithine racemase